MIAIISIRERHLEGCPGYVVFFDNVRMDQFIKSFEVSLSSDGSIGSASFDFIYVPDFYKLEKYNPDTGDVLSVEQGIENMTNVKVFIKNMFNNKYVLVFDGNIRGKSRTRSPNGYSLAFAAQDYMTWLNRTIVPIAIPPENSITPGDRLKWKAQGIDIDNASGIVEAGEGIFRGQTMEQFIGKMQNTTLKVNKFYSSEDGVSFWDGVQDRITIMGDIDDQLIQNKVIDFVVTSSATFVNSMYVGINDIAKNLMFEFYQDRDGYIRIKPPFWNEKVLYDHIIEPLLIMSISENTNYSGFYTRTLVTGGVEEQEEDLDSTDQSYITPCGAYVPYPSQVNDVWSDFDAGNEGESSTTVSTGGAGTWLSGHELFSPWGQWRDNATYGRYQHGGNDYDMSVGTAVKHIGYPGIATNGNEGYHKGWGNYVQVIISEGPYKGYMIFYCHLESGNVRDGQAVKNGDTIGYSGISGNAYNTTRPHLHLEIRDKTGQKGMQHSVNSEVYIATSLGEDSGKSTIINYGSNKLLDPSPDEKKYGASVYDITQPLIKFSNSNIIDKNDLGKNALAKYAKFIYQLTNSMVETASMQVVAMPWLRPGFNVWVDPIGVDKVYYVHSVSHHGSAEGGVYTSLNLSLGRDRVKYTGATTFGAMGNINGENLFINKFNVRASDFGKVLESSSEFDSIKKQCIDFHKNENNLEIIKTDVDPYFATFYGTIDHAPTTGSSTSSSQSTSTELTVITLGADTYNVVDWPTLRKGSENQYVTELQKALKKLGNYTESYYDQIFGSITRKAVVDFQTKFKLDADGVVGNITKAKIQEQLWIAGGSTPNSTYNTSSQNKLTPDLLCRDYTIEEIKSKLDAIYAKAPAVVSARATKLSELVSGASDYIRLHYISEYNG